jgi:hypothetical protein
VNETGGPGSKDDMGGVIREGEQAVVNITRGGPELPELRGARVSSLVEGVAVERAAAKSGR